MCGFPQPFRSSGCPELGTEACSSRECRATSSVLADTHVGLPATHVRGRHCAGALGFHPQCSRSPLDSCECAGALVGGAGRNSRNPCCAHCPLSGPEQELGPRGHPNPVFSASSTAAGYVFCMLHRLPEQHDCTFDHMGRGREEAIMKMVKLDRKVGRSCQRIGEGCS